MNKNSVPKCFKSTKLKNLFVLYKRVNCTVFMFILTLVCKSLEFQVSVKLWVESVCCDTQGPCLWWSWSKVWMCEWVGGPKCLWRTEFKMYLCNVQSVCEGQSSKCLWGHDIKCLCKGHGSVSLRSGFKMSLRVRVRNGLWVSCSKCFVSKLPKVSLNVWGQSVCKVRVQGF